MIVESFRYMGELVEWRTATPEEDKEWQENPTCDFKEFYKKDSMMLFIAETYICGKYAVIKIPIARNLLKDTDKEGLEDFIEMVIREQIDWEIERWKNEKSKNGRG